MAEKHDHNWDMIYTPSKSNTDTSNVRQRVSQFHESEELRRLFPQQRNVFDSHLHHGVMSDEDDGSARANIPTSGLALLSEAAADKSFDRHPQKNDASVDLTMHSNPNSQIPSSLYSSISVPKYPHPIPHLKAFREDLVSTSSGTQVPVTDSESLGEYLDELPYSQGQQSQFRCKPSLVDNIPPSWGLPRNSYNHINPSQPRSQDQMTNTFLTSTDRLMAPVGQPYSDIVKEGLYHRVNENSPGSLSSTSIGQDLHQSRCDSLETMAKERRDRADDSMSLDVEVVDLQTRNDGELKKVVSSLSDRDSGRVLGSCGTSPTSTTSSPSPSSHALIDGESDLRNLDGELLQKISKSSSVFRTKYFPNYSSLKLAEKTLHRVLPTLKHKQPSSTVSSAGSEGDTAHERASVKGHEDMELDSDGADLVDSSTGNSEQPDGVIKKEVFCQVCGDIAAGFYCGAYICEACKKFFVRASRQEKIKYVCHKSESCVITKETRVRCQYCRYQKCLKLNMYSPGDNQGKEAGAGISSIPCRVCGGASSGFHFGALTCEGCKGFFRRMAKEREWHSYKCTKDNQCEISMLTRNVCKACRYRKCLEAGMSVEASRIGRQPNAIKHAISVEARKQESRGSDGKAVGGDQFSLDFAAFSRAHSKLPALKIKKELDLEVVENTIQAVKDAWKELSTLHTHDKVCYETYNLNCDDIKNTWKTVMVHFEFNAKCIIKFSKKLPKFQTLCIEDQVSLIQMATYSLCILNHCQFYNLETQEYRFFDFTKSEEISILKFFPQFSVIPKHFRHFGLMLKKPNFDDTELAFLSSLVLLNTENLTMKDKAMADKLHGELLESLQIYMERNHTDHETRMGYLLLRISELAVASLQHNQCVGAVAKANPELENQLWDEMYLK